MLKETKHLSKIVIFISHLQILSQFNWIYLSDRGRRYTVGFYHSPTNGHFMVYCNNRIIVIDFHVLKPKKYSFFIEDQLMELRIDKNNDEYTYGLEVNDKVDTHRNRLMKKLQRKDLRISLFIFGFMLLSICSIIIFLIRQGII